MARFPHRFKVAVPHDFSGEKLQDTVGLKGAHFWELQKGPELQGRNGLRYNPISHLVPLLEFNPSFSNSRGRRPGKPLQMDIVVKRSALQELRSGPHGVEPGRQDHDQRL
jgi:hypothetical protein